MTADETRDAQSGVEAVLARVMAEHQRRLTPGGPCWCRAWPDDARADATAWMAHVAAAQAAALGEVIAAERAKALREAADYLPAEDRLPDEPTVRIAVKRWLRDRADREQP